MYKTAVDVSLDNITFMGRWRSPSDLADLLEWALVKTPQDVKHFGVRHKQGAWQQSFLVDGVHMSLSLDDQEKQHGEHPARIEFNPNKLTDRGLAFVRLGEWDKVSRVDVAVDYLGVPIGDYSFGRPRVKTTTHCGRGGVESVYLGRRTSERFVRIYDKGLELGRDDLTMTRCEGVARHRYVMDARLFDGVRAYRCEIAPDLPVGRAAMLALALHYPERFASCDKRTRASVLADLESVGQPLSPHPDEVYRDSLDGLREQVGALSVGERVPVAQVYGGVENGDV